MDGRLLAMCAHLAAQLPYRRGDEPLLLVHHVNAAVSRRGEDVLSSLKASLAAQQPRDSGGQTQQVSILLYRHLALHVAGGRQWHIPPP